MSPQRRDPGTEAEAEGTREGQIEEQPQNIQELVWNKWYKIKTGKRSINLFVSASKGA